MRAALAESKNLNDVLNEYLYKKGCILMQKSKSGPGMRFFFDRNRNRNRSRNRNAETASRKPQFATVFQKFSTQIFASLVITDPLKNYHDLWSQALYIKPFYQL